MDIKAQRICNILKDNLIEYNTFEHEAVYTIEDVKNAHLSIPGIPTKNLFLRDKKKTKYFLLVCPEDKKVNLKLLSQTIETKNICFASEEDLEKILDLEMGDVGPFGIVNDKEHKVIILIDRDLVNKKDINLSANSLTTTITIDYSELVNFVQIIGNILKVVDCN